MNFYTIGVYGTTEETYFSKLSKANIDLFCDIRQRRGVRGKEYSFVNSKRLQKKLSDLNIQYIHIKDLAPTKEIRDKQKKDDLDLNVLKRDRNTLGNTFISEYKQNIINNFDFNDLIKYFKENNFSNIIFFCVEEKAKACHRSLVANQIEILYGTTIKDL
jgi:uncharacterized protein (DUF488 family)